MSDPKLLDPPAWVYDDDLPVPDPVDEPFWWLVEDDQGFEDYSSGADLQKTISLYNKGVVTAMLLTA